MNITTSPPPRKTPTGRPTDEEFWTDVSQRMQAAYDRHPGLEAFHTGSYTPFDADQDDEFMQQVRNREFATEPEGRS